LRAEAQHGILKKSRANRELREPGPELGNRSGTKVGRDRAGSERTHLVNVAQGDLLDRLVLEHLTDNTAVTTTDDEDVDGVGVGGQGQVRDHLLVATTFQRFSDSPRLPAAPWASEADGDSRELVTLRALDDAVEDEDIAVRRRREDEDILRALARVQAVGMALHH
jgi:hypothetical protein